MTRFRVVVSREGAAVMRECSSGEIASAFGRKEHLVDANSSHETTTVLLSCSYEPPLSIVEEVA
ncbi:MAG: hypothetical protein M3Z24_00415 [Chloroflexota bacterium]|nr:hypothetical protein [Chloroflexota bacterium]